MGSCSRHSVILRGPSLYFTLVDGQCNGHHRSVLISRRSVTVRGQISSRFCFVQGPCSEGPLGNLEGIDIARNGGIVDYGYTVVNSILQAYSVR